MTATEQVILVDENDQAIGTADKLAAHQQGLRHRAFSVFILRKEPEIKILLQQRAKTKYHSAGLWTNTCCSHPRIDETIIQAGERRVLEELGIKTSLISVGKFHYIAHLENGLIENEIDHVLVGWLDDPIFTPNPLEVKATRWIAPDVLKQDMAADSKQFTAWLPKALTHIEKYYLGGL